MRSFLKAMFAVLPLAALVAVPASASDSWRQSCSGPAYVCGGETASVTKSSSTKSTKVASHKVKTNKVAHVKTKKSVSVASDDTPVKVKKAKKYASAPKAKVKVAKSKGNKEGGSSYQSGMASWYGGNFNGRKTANGEIYNMNEMTAAHKTLPFGTRVRVTNTRNGDSTIVRINDRGPFVGGRVIDLSRAAASDIGITNSGVGPVKLTILGKG